MQETNDEFEHAPAVNSREKVSKYGLMISPLPPSAIFQHYTLKTKNVKGKKLLVDALYRSVKRRLSKLVCNRLIQISMASQDSGLRADYTQDNWLFRRSWCSGLNIPEN
jgi:hypothetical protein